MIKKKKNKISEDKNIGKFSNSEFYFDDCMICQAMKSAEEKGKDLNLNELKRLFEKANKKNN